MYIDMIISIILKYLKVELKYDDKTFLGKHDNFIEAHSLSWTSCSQFTFLSFIEKDMK